MFAAMSSHGTATGARHAAWLASLSAITSRRLRINRIKISTPSPACKLYAGHATSKRHDANGYGGNKRKGAKNVHLENWRGRELVQEMMD